MQISYSPFIIFQNPLKKVARSLVKEYCSHFSRVFKLQRQQKHKQQQQSKRKYKKIYKSICIYRPILVQTFKIMYLYTAFCLIKKKK